MKQYCIVFIWNTNLFNQNYLKHKQWKNSIVLQQKWALVHMGKDKKHLCPVFFISCFLYPLFFLSESLHQEVQTLTVALPDNPHNWDIISFSVIK